MKKHDKVYNKEKKGTMLLYKMATGNLMKKHFILLCYIFSREKKTDKEERTKKTSCGK